MPQELAPLTSCQSGFGLVVRFAFAFRGAFVVLGLPFGQGDLALDPAVAKIQPYRDQREAFLLGGGFELADLLLMQQKLARAQLP